MCLALRASRQCLRYSTLEILPSGNLVHRRGAKVNTESMYGYTPLIIAAWHGNTGAVEMLLEEGADAFAKDSTDMTSLHWAASHEHPEIVKLLLQDKCDIHDFIT